MNVKKTFSFSDVRVINKLEEIRWHGGNMSQYVSNLILNDIKSEQNKFTADEIMAMIREIVINESTNVGESRKDEVKIKNNESQLNDLMMSILDE